MAAVIRTVSHPADHFHDQRFRKGFWRGMTSPVETHANVALAGERKPNLVLPRAFRVSHCQPSERRLDPDSVDLWLPAGAQEHLRIGMPLQGESSVASRELEVLGSVVREGGAQLRDIALDLGHRFFPGVWSLGRDQIVLSQLCGLPLFLFAASRCFLLLEPVNPVAHCAGLLDFDIQRYPHRLSSLQVGPEVSADRPFRCRCVSQSPGLQSDATEGPHYRSRARREFDPDPFPVRQIFGHVIGMLEERQPCLWLAGRQPGYLIVLHRPPGFLEYVDKLADKQALIFFSDGTAESESLARRQLGSEDLNKAGPLFCSQYTQRPRWRRPDRGTEIANDDGHDQESQPLTESSRRAGCGPADHWQVHDRERQECEERNQ